MASGASCSLKSSCCTVHQLGTPQARCIEGSRGLGSNFPKCDLCVQGWYTAFGMFGIAAANNGKAKEAADLAAELVHMGWGVLVSRSTTRLSHICSRQCVATTPLP